MLVSGVQHNDLIFVYTEMVTISLVTVHHHTKLQFLCVCVTRTFKIYSLGNFQIRTALLLTIVTVLSITSHDLIHFITGSLYFLTSFTHDIQHFLNTWIFLM